MGGKALLGHDAVKGVPVVMRAAGGGEDVPEKDSELLGVEVRLRIVGTDKRHRTFHRHPLPPRSGDERGAGSRPEIRELVGIATRDEADHRFVRHRMTEHTGVHDRRLDTGVVAEGGHDHEPGLPPR